MTHYDIKRWDVVMFNNSTTKVPVIYFKPDKNLLDFIQANNSILMINITDSNTVYDNKEIPAIIDRSDNIPNCRPNYFEKTGYYVASLYANWYGYPNMDCLGKVSFSGFNLPGEKTNTIKTLKSFESYSNNKDQKKHKTNSYIILAISIIGILLFILFLVNLYDKTNYDKY